MAESRRVVPFLNVGVQFRLVAAANGRNEVGKMVAARSHGGGRNRLRLAAPLGITLLAGDKSAFAVENVVALRSGVRIVFRGQTAHLEDQLRVAVVEKGDLRVGGLSLVFVAETAAKADHALGERRAVDP